MWRLLPIELGHLRGDGSRFAQFVDRLIRAEAAQGGLTQSEITTQLRAYVPDGGVDTEVRQSVPHDKSGWFGVSTCWQYKAVEASSIDDKKRKRKPNNLQDEIRKPYVVELIRKGYGYRLCLLGDLPPKKVADWEAQLKHEAQAIYPQASAPRVIQGGDLLPWAERFLGVIAWLRGSTPDVFDLETWAQNCRQITKIYVPNPAWEGIRQQILQHAQLNSACIGGQACLPVSGAAGVGKTRLVFETVAQLKEAPALVVYARDEGEAKRIATTIATQREQNAILVADDCGLPVRSFLNEHLKGHIDRIRVICIDNTGKQPVAAPPLYWLSSDSLTNTEEILAKNYGHVPEDRRRLYLRLSRGYVRLAADMCERDVELASGDLTGLLISIEEYVKERLRRMDSEFLPIVSLLALFHKVGVRDDVAGELDSLWSLTSYTRHQFEAVVRVVKDAPGFVVQAGRYWYVTPEIVARVLFAEGWQRWVAPNRKGFFEQLPSHLLQQLLERVSTHGTKEVGEQVGSFFRGWFNQLTARDLADAPTAALAAALVEASPGEYLPQLRAVIETAKAGELQEIKQYAASGGWSPGRTGGWGPRRTLVWLLERLVSFREYFEDCEACLFRLAVEESEPQIGNNATAIWANLFSVYLSGTAQPFQERLLFLQRRLESSGSDQARLGFVGLAKALQMSEGHILGEPVVAGRLRPEDWRPVTVGEDRSCFRSALALCGQQLSGSPENHRLAFGLLTNSIYFLLRRSLLDDLRRIVTPQNLSDEEARRLVRALDTFLEYEETKGNGQADEPVVAYMQKVRAWSEVFRPSDFAGRLRDVCARAPWDQRFAQDVTNDRDETDELAALILQQPSLLSPHLDWLASPEAESAERLGFALGRTDTARDCGRMIFEHAIARKAAPLLRGYVRGMGFAQRQPTPDLLQLMTELESAHPELAVDILSVAGDSFHAFDRIVRLMEARAVAPRFLAMVASGLGRRHLRPDEVTSLLPYFTRAAQAGDADSARAGVRFLAMTLLFESRQAAQTCLASDTTRSFAWQLVESALPFLTGQHGAEWGEILKKLAVFDPDRASRLFGQALVDENITLPRVVEQALAQLAKTNPESVMAGLGSALLDPERGWRLQVQVCRDLVGQLPADVMLAWVHDHGLEAARAIARHLPLPHLDDAGNAVVPKALDTILREYDDDQVFANFLGGSHSGEVWWGNGADQFRHAAEIAKKFLTHPNRRIQEWAKNEVNYRQGLAEREDQEHEERLLPL